MADAQQVIRSAWVWPAPLDPMLWLALAAAVLAEADVLAETERQSNG